MNTLRKTILSVVLAGGFILGAGVFSTANAQDWRWNRQRNRDYGQVDRNGNIDRNRNGIDDRYEVNGQVDINRNGIPDNQEGYYRNGRNRGYNGYYGTGGYRDYGYYGNGGYYGGGYGYNNYDIQRGYRDGLDRGFEDAHSGRYPSPNNSQHFRIGNAAYREGFSRGYNIGYRQARAGW